MEAPPSPRSLSSSSDDDDKLLADLCPAAAGAAGADGATAPAAAAAPAAEAEAEAEEAEGDPQAPDMVFVGHPSDANTAYGPASQRLVLFKGRRDSPKMLMALPKSLDLYKLHPNDDE